MNDRPQLPDSPARPAPAAGDAATDPAALGRIWRWLRVCLDLLIAVLLVFVAVRGIATADAGHLSPATWLWLAAFAIVYAIGRMQPDDGPRWWLPAVIACFTGLAWTSPDGVWLAFPLFFLVLQAVAGWYAVALVGVLTALAIGTIAWHGGWSVGGVAGPVLGAAVALMVGLGFRMLLQEATTRAEAIDELLAARADVAEMSRRAGELDERARLAADIHDTVAQGLSSIQLLLHSAEASARDHDDAARTPDDRAPPPSAPSGRSEPGEVAADNLRETRRIIAALQPALLPGRIRRWRWPASAPPPRPPPGDPGDVHRRRRRPPPAGRRRGHARPRRAGQHRQRRPPRPRRPVRCHADLPARLRVPRRRR